MSDAIMIVLVNAKARKSLPPAFHDWLQNISLKDRLPRGKIFRGRRAIVITGDSECWGSGSFAIAAAQARGLSSGLILGVQK